jgi:hypothetical protein
VWKINFEGNVKYYSYYFLGCSPGGKLDCRLLADDCLITSVSIFSSSRASLPVEKEAWGYFQLSTSRSFIFTKPPTRN